MFYEELKKYFETTSQNKVLEDWAKSKEFDKIGPTVEEFVRSSQFYHAYSNDPNDWCLQNIDKHLSPSYTSGFFNNFNHVKNAKSSLFYCNI
jgi:hypothetical protein